MDALGVWLADCMLPEAVEGSELAARNGITSDAAGLSDDGGPQASHQGTGGTGVYHRAPGDISADWWL